MFVKEDPDLGEPSAAAGAPAAALGPPGMLQGRIVNAEDGKPVIGARVFVAGTPIDVLFAITWLRMLPEAALRLPRHLAINFHDGPLPRYSGLNATCWALLHGEREHAVTWHVIEKAADTGAILVQRSFAIEPDDTAFTLNARCFQPGQESFPELVRQQASNELAPQPQDPGKRSYFGKHARPDALLEST